jgi:5-methylcytosine-specific restriction protein A
MAWDGSDRRSRLPADWPKRVAQTRRRAEGRCEHRYSDGSRCTSAGSECDHRVRGDDHSLDNLQWLCTPHHRDKTQREAAAARAAAPRPTRARPREPHPGAR